MNSEKKITSRNILLIPFLSNDLRNAVVVCINWTSNSEIASIEIRKKIVRINTISFKHVIAADTNGS